MNMETTIGCSLGKPQQRDIKENITETEFTH